MDGRKRKFISSPFTREETISEGGLRPHLHRKIDQASLDQRSKDELLAATLPSFPAFPSLVLCHIFQYLELVELVRLSRVATTIQYEINKYLWTLNQIALPREMRNMPDDGWSKIIYKCPHLTYLDASACALPPDTIVNMVKRHPQIKILRTVYDAWDHKMHTANRNYSLYLLENIPHTLERMNLCVADVHKLQQQLPQCQNLRALTLWRTPLLPNILTPQLALPPTTRTLKLFNIDFEHNAMRDCLLSATNLRSLKLRDCYYDDPQELAPLAEKHLTKLEIMHCPVGDSLANIDSSSLVKFGIDWCPGAARDVQPEVLMNMLAKATRLRSLKLSSGSLDHMLVNKLQEANPIPKSLQKLQITAFSSCNVIDANIDDADSLRLLALFPPSLSQLSLCHFPRTHCVPLCHFPYLQTLELSDVGTQLQDIEQSLKGLSHLSNLVLRDMVGVSAFKICNASLNHAVLDKCMLQSVDFEGCPQLEHIKLREMSNLTKFNVDASCRHLQKLVVKKCRMLHHFLISAQFFEMKKTLLSLNTIKIEDCEFCYHDVRLCLEYMKTQLLCALVDLSEGDNICRVKHMQHLVCGACSKLVNHGISSSCPKDLSDITVEPTLRMVTNFPFYQWIEIISNNSMPVRRKSISEWLFCMFKIQDYYNVGTAY